MKRSILILIVAFAVSPGCKSRSTSNSEPQSTWQPEWEQKQFHFHWSEVLPGTWTDSGQNLEFYLEIHACALTDGRATDDSCSGIPLGAVRTHRRPHLIWSTPVFNVPVGAAHTYDPGIKFDIAGTFVRKGFSDLGLKHGVQDYAIGIELKEENFFWAGGDVQIAFAAVSLDKIAAHLDEEITFDLIDDTKGAHAKVQMLIK